MAVSLRIFLLVTLVSSLAAACASEVDGNDPDVLDLRVEVPPPYAEGEGLQFVQPEEILEAGQERMTCWVPDWVPDHDYFIRRFEGVQGDTGHHVVALRSAIPRNPGDVFDCTDFESLTGFEPLILPDPEDRTLLPEDFYVRLPANTLIVIQSHNINYHRKAVRVADVARFELFPADREGTEAGYLIMNHAGIDLPARSPSELSMNCNPGGTAPLNVFAFFGHMHEMGSAIRVDMERDGNAETLYEIDRWRPDFRDLPPMLTWDIGDEMQVMPDDQLRLTCAFDNITDEPVYFPTEMCTAVGYFHPVTDSPLIICDN